MCYAMVILAAMMGTPVKVRPECLKVRDRVRDTAERDLRVERLGRIRTLAKSSFTSIETFAILRWEE